MKANITIFKEFFTQNKISALRIYIFCANRFNNHLQKRHFNQIRKELKVSNSVIYKALSQMEQMGMCTRVSKYYWRFNSWKKFSTNTNSKNIYTTLDVVRDIKKLRSLYYTIYLKRSVKIAERNTLESKTCNRLKLGGFSQVSASFAATISGLNTSAMAKHIRRCKEYSFIEVRKSVNFIASGTYAEMKKLSKYIENSLIKRKKNQCVLISFDSNFIKMKV